LRGVKFELKFSLRLLLGLVTLAAAVLAAVSFIAARNRLNAQTEFFAICGRESLLSWQHSQGEFIGSGVRSNIQPIELDWDETGDFMQEILFASYDDYWGNESFQWKATFWGNRENGASSLVLIPEVVGGGSTDGGVTLLSNFDEEDGELAILIITRIGSAQKQATVNIRWDGTRFQNEALE
jgi:hypothetical protein